jgi:hypothetical protein
MAFTLSKTARAAGWPAKKSAVCITSQQRLSSAEPGGELDP